jgi:hypothetical protein
VSIEEEKKKKKQERESELRELREGTFLIN